MRVKITTILEFNLKNQEITWSSYKERKGNALALRAEEGRS